jgi:hypothetical protein
MKSMTAPDTPSAEPRGRRAAFAFLASAVAALAVAACSVAPPSWQQRRDSPFWEREEQRD